MILINTLKAFLKVILIFLPNFYFNFTFPNLIFTFSQLSPTSKGNFKSRYRLSKQSFLWLTNQLNLETKRRGNFISSNFDILCFLRYLCTGSFMQVSGDLVNISKSSSHRAIHKVMRSIANISERHIKFPENLLETNRQFFELRGFPNVSGAIDGTHIPIQSVGGPLAECFRNRKGHFSINVQCVSDTNLKFMDAVVRWPGSTHDSRILDNSNVNYRFDNGLIPGLLLGDAGYALKTWLMTPLSNPQTASEKSNP